MKKQKMTEPERRYRRFDLISTVFLYAALGSTVVFGICFVFAQSDDLKSLFGLLTSLCPIIIFITAPGIAKKRTLFLRQLQVEKNSNAQMGLFSEIYDAYMQNEFELNLNYDKLQFSEHFNNSIDIGLQRNKHEFLIEIDERSISIIVDEETDRPTETEIPLSDITATEQIFSVINEFINKHS